MRKLLAVLFATAVVFGFAMQATAGTSNYAGTIQVNIGSLAPAIVTGTGVATLNQMNGGTHVTTLTLGASDIAGSDVVPVTDPDGIAGNGIVSVRLTVTNGAGTLGKIVPGSSANTITPLTQNTMGLAGGLLRLCLFFPGCGLNLPLGLAGSTHTAGTSTVAIGVGIGGQQTIGGSGALRVSIDARPWTVLTGSMIDQPDTGGSVTASGGAGTGYTVATAKGTAHGPASLASTVALGGASGSPGVLQFVTPTQTTTNITATSSQRIASPVILTVRLVPEPGMMLLIVSGVAGLAVLGHRRMKK